MALTQRRLKDQQCPALPRAKFSAVASSFVSAFREQSPHCEALSKPVTLEIFVDLVAVGAPFFRRHLQPELLPRTHTLSTYAIPETTRKHFSFLSVLSVRSPVSLPKSFCDIGSAHSLASNFLLASLCVFFELENSRDKKHSVRLRTFFFFPTSRKMVTSFRDSVQLEGLELALPAQLTDFTDIPRHYTSWCYLLLYTVSLYFI